MQIKFFNLVHNRIGNLGVDTTTVLATGQVEVTSLAPLVAPAVLDDPGVGGVADNGDGVVDLGRAARVVEDTGTVVLGAQGGSIEQDIEWAEVHQRLLHLVLVEVLGVQSVAIVVDGSHTPVVDVGHGSLATDAVVLLLVVREAALVSLAMGLDELEAGVAETTVASVPLHTIDQLLLGKVIVDVVGLVVDEEGRLDRGGNGKAPAALKKLKLATKSTTNVACSTAYPPQRPWFLTGVTARWARQSKSLGTPPPR